jgi:hypothetical protein
MGHGDQWDRARRAAADVVGSLRNGDRATLVLFDTTAELAVQGTDDRGRLQGEISAAQLSSGATRYGPALKLAGSLLAPSKLPRREVVLVSDFQRSGWSPGDGLRLPAGTIVTPVEVKATDTRNVTVAPVSVQREQVSGQERVTVTSGVLNRSDQAMTDVPVSLEIEGHPTQSIRVSVAAHGSASATFSPLTLTQPNSRGTVRVGDDALARDNAFHFVLSPGAAVPVTLVNGARGSRDPALYLSRALAIGEAPRFAATTRAAEDLSDEVLASTRVVIFNDASVSDAVSKRLARFVEQGGAVLVIFGPQASWPQSAAAWLPASAGASVDRSRGAAATMGGLAYGHAVFEPFRAPRSGDFSAARFYGYRSATPAADAQVLARFDDGAPAVVERSVGRGRVIAWTSTLDLFWSDLPLKPVYLPFVHQLMRHLADHRDRPHWATVGQVIDLSEMGDPSRARIAVTPGGSRLPLEGEQGRVLELREQGFYEVRDQSRQAMLLGIAASNVEFAESDPNPVDPAEIVAAVSGGAAGTSAAEDALTLPAEAQERAQRLWWYLLFAGILLLTGESVLAHRLSRARG